MQELDEDAYPKGEDVVNWRNEFPAKIVQVLFHCLPRCRFVTIKDKDKGDRREVQDLWLIIH